LQLVCQRVALLLLTALLLQTSALLQDAKPGLTPQLKSEIKKLIKELFDAKGHEAKAQAIEKIEQIELNHLISKADLEEMRKAAFGHVSSGVRHNGSGRCKFGHPDYPGEYIIRGANGGAKVPLFIGLHGGGQGVGDASQIAGLFGSGMQGAVVVYPTVVKKDATAWNTEREEQYVLELIECMKRSFSIDTNRIYLAGHSMGGYGTWSIGGRHADLFAAIAPMAGGIFTMGKGPNGGVEIAPGCAANLKNTPIWFYHGANDRQVGPEPDRRAAQVLKELKEKYGPYDYIYKEYPNIGHGTPPDGVAPIFQWMSTKRRNPYPKMVIWEATRAYKKLFWWVKLRNGAGGFGAGRTVVKIDSGNKFVVEQGGSGLEIFLNEKMGISLSKEITVVDSSGQELYRGRPDPSIAALVESIEARRDPEMTFTARIRVK
jgi:predicted esterase